MRPIAPFVEKRSHDIERRLSGPARILIADDHTVVRRGLRDLLETRPGWEVCAEVGTGREAVEVAQKLRPDVIILDVVMPEMDGLEAARQILRARPESEVLILTVHESPELVRHLVDVGVRGYVLKQDAGRDLISAVDALRQHKSFFSSRISGIMMDGFLSKRGRRIRKGSPLDRLIGGGELVALLSETKNRQDLIDLGIRPRHGAKS